MGGSAVGAHEDIVELNKKYTYFSWSAQEGVTPIAVEKAKGIFMRRLNLDEPEAHKRLQQESQKRRISIGELAKRIIESEEMLGGS